MDKLKTYAKYAKNKWVWVIILGMAALIGGGTYSDQVTQALLVILGQA